MTAPIVLIVILGLVVLVALSSIRIAKDSSSSFPWGSTG
jgi:hypothetical protein